MMKILATAPPSTGCRSVRQGWCYHHSSCPLTTLPMNNNRHRPWPAPPRREMLRDYQIITGISHELVWLVSSGPEWHRWQGEDRFGVFVLIRNKWVIMCLCFWLRGESQGVSVSSSDTEFGLRRWYFRGDCFIPYKERKHIAPLINELKNSLALKHILAQWHKYSQQLRSMKCRVLVRLM